MQNFMTIINKKSTSWIKVLIKIQNTNTNQLCITKIMEQI